MGLAAHRSRHPHAAGRSPRGDRRARHHGRREPLQYGLDALCEWRGIAGKDDAGLRQGIEALELVENKRKKLRPAAHIWQLPARFVGPYAEQDVISTLALFENLNPILDREGTRDAYRLECDLLPMVLEMRLRGIRVDLDAAERARDLLIGKRDAVFAELSEKLECPVGMEEIGRTKWLAETFDRLKIKYPRTEKGNPSFTKDWMPQHKHWLPQLITKADRYNNAATKFLENFILGHAVNGRLHAEIHPHRSEDNGTKSFRFSYSDPALQQMPARDKELAPLIRGCFLPEEGEFWAKPDASQQEFRLVVHYANLHRLRKAADAVARYRDDPDADFHAVAAAMTGLDRDAAKTVNFSQIYGAGVRMFASKIGKPVAEAQRLYDQYDRELPFLKRLSEIYEDQARRQGFITLYDGARRHFNRWAPGGKWEKGAGPVELEEARERIKDPNHPWRGQLFRADTRNALNALIQGSAARHTKLWMRAVLARRHRPPAANARRPRLLGELARAGGTGRPVGRRGGQARRADAGRSQVRSHLGRCLAQLGGAQRRGEPRSPVAAMPSIARQPMTAAAGSANASIVPNRSRPGRRGSTSTVDGCIRIVSMPTCRTARPQRASRRGNRPACDPDGSDGGDHRPPWTTPAIEEVPPGTAVFNAILASLKPEDLALVRPPHRRPRRSPRSRRSAPARSRRHVLHPSGTGQRSP